MNPKIISSFAIMSIFLFSNFSGKGDYVYEYLKIVDLTYKPIIEVTLNGKSAYFLVDTGSDITILHARDSKKYGFDTVKNNSHNHSVVGLSGRITTLYSTRNVKLKVGSSRVMNRYLALDISSLVQMIHKRSSIRISGIIGSDLMKRYGFVIDYANKQIGILTVKKEAPADNQGVIATTHP